MVSEIVQAVQSPGWPKQVPLQLPEESASQKDGGAGYDLKNLQVELRPPEPPTASNTSASQHQVPLPPIQMVESFYQPSVMHCGAEIERLRKTLKASKKDRYKCFRQLKQISLQREAMQRENVNLRK